jgi:hypothetical protein
VKPPCFFQDILQAPGIREILFCYWKLSMWAIH